MRRAGCWPQSRIAPGPLTRQGPGQPNGIHGSFSRGLCLAELLVTGAVLVVLASLALQSGGSAQARRQVETSTRRIALGLEMGRAAAERRGEACALSLDPGGWGPPHGGELPTCQGVSLGLVEGLNGEAVTVEHNLPAVVRFSSNGLVLDGGTVRVSSSGTALVRCLVVALPLGVVRLGRVGGDGSCQPDPSL